MAKLLTILLTLTSKLCYCSKISAYYTFYPDFESFGNYGFDCLVKIAQSPAVLKYNDSTRTCDLLDSSWQTNPVVEPGFVYSYIAEYERPFEEAMSVESEIPAGFQFGHKFDVIFRTIDFIGDWYTIVVHEHETSKKVMYFNIRPSWNKIIINTNDGTQWEGQIDLPNPIQSTDTVYNVTFIYRTSEWETHIDGTFFHALPHRHDFSGQGTVAFGAHDVYCQRIIYYSTTFY